MLGWLSCWKHNFISAFIGDDWQAKIWDYLFIVAERAINSSKLLISSPLKMTMRELIAWYGTYVSSILTHWGWVTHICISKLTIIGSDNGLSPSRRQASIWTNAGILLIGPLGTNFSEILIKIHTFSFNKMHLKMSCGKCRPSCLSLNVFRSSWECLPHAAWQDEHLITIIEIFSTSEIYSTKNHGTIHMVTSEISITVSGDPY